MESGTATDTRMSNGKRVLCAMRWPLGGIRTYLLYNYPLLRDHGFRFTFVGPNDESFRAFREGFRDWEEIEFAAAPIVKRGCLLRREIRRLLRTGRYAQIHSQGFTAAFESMTANLGLGIPHLVTSHDVILPGQYRGLIGRVKREILGRTLGRADVIISVSEDAQANLLASLPRVPRDRCITIPNGIDVRHLGGPGQSQEKDSSLRGRHNLGEDVFLIGFLGRFMEQKGFLPLLRALKQLISRPPERRFHLIAVGKGDYIREYQAEAARLGVTERVTFLDFQPNPASVLKQLNLVVIPSLWEACPLLPMEAMMLGVPVLGTNCIGLREVLRDTPSLMVPAGDDVELAEGLQFAITKPWPDAARAFAPRARVRFDVANSARRLLGVFTQLSPQLRTELVSSGSAALSTHGT